MANLLKLYVDTQNNALVQSDSDVAGGFTPWETAVCCPLAAGYSKANRGQLTASSSTPRQRRRKQPRRWPLTLGLMSLDVGKRFIWVIPVLLVPRKHCCIRSLMCGDPRPPSAKFSCPLIKYVGHGFLGESFVSRFVHSTQKRMSHS